jgi:hypothetical protein
MAGTRLHGAYYSALLSLALLGGLPGRAEAQSTGTLRLNVLDYAGISHSAMADAMKTATGIYAAVGVEVGWTYRCFRGCGGQVVVARESSVNAATDLTIFIRPEVMSFTRFPRSVMGSAPRGSSVAYTFLDRMTEFAFKRKLLVATVLGHVIAHEVGHLLLRQGHTAGGLMREEWFKHDLDLARTGRLGFTPEQGARIRAQLAQKP